MSSPAGLIQHSNSPYATAPWSTSPRRERNFRRTVDYKKLNTVSSLGQPPTASVDEIFGSPAKGRIFSLFDIVSSFHQTRHRSTRTPYHTPHSLLHPHPTPRTARHASR